MENQHQEADNGQVLEEESNNNQETQEVEVENINDTSNLSDDEFENNFDKIPESTDTDEEILIPIEPEVQSSMAQEEENQNTNTSVNGQDQTDTTPFNKDLFNQLPPEYQKVFQPIKANGTEITPTPDKMIQLMQLGSKYYADREMIKPQLQTVKTLEKEGIDADTLNFLIDLNKGDKTAIAKLLADKELDIYDIDDSKADEYQANDYRPAESEMVLEQTISKIENSPMFDTLINNLSNYDEQSKEMIKGNPEILEIMNEHLETGVYDKVNSVIAEEKILGKHLNQPFVDSYKQTLDRLIADGVFSQPNQNNQANQVNQQVQEQINQARQNVNQNTQNQQAVNNPSQALAPNQTRVAQQQAPVSNDNEWGSMSDEEYLEKLGF